MLFYILGAFVFFIGWVFEEGGGLGEVVEVTDEIGARPQLEPQITSLYKCKFN